MTTGKAEKAEDKKLVENDTLSVRNILAQIKGSTKKQLRRETLPHIRPHKVNGRTYYNYVDGSGPEKYLGDADFIFRAVRIYRQQGGK